MAESAYRRACYEQAWDEVEAAFAFAQPTAERHVLAARIARRLGDDKEAEHHLWSALAMSPGHERALVLQTATIYESGRTEEALARLTELQERDGRLQRFQQAHANGDRMSAVGHLLALASSDDHPQAKIA